MANKSRLSRLEARYCAYQHAFSWVSEVAEPHYDSDFYNELRSAQLLDKSKLDTIMPYEKNKTVFVPKEEEIKLIKEEFMKLSGILGKELVKCRNKYKGKMKDNI